MAPEPSIRLFLGSPLTRVAKTALEAIYQQQDELSRAWQAKLSWVRPETYHMTWLFIGEVTGQKAEAITRRTEKLLHGVTAMDLPLCRLAFWPNARKPRLLVWEGDPQIAAVQEFIGKIRAAFPGYADKKPFKPHLTVARFRHRTGSEPLTLPVSLDPISWHLDEISLYQSILDPKGAIHRPLQTWMLPEG